MEIINLNEKVYFSIKTNKQTIKNIIRQDKND